jgi:hypothetical protein
MPTLPDRDVLGPAPSLRSNRPIARIDTSAIGQGAARLGRSISYIGQVAEDIAQKNLQREAFDAESKFQQFDAQQRNDLIAAKRNVQPGQANDFAAQWQAQYKSSADQLFDTIPEPLKRRYEAKLFGTQQELYSDALTFQQDEQRRSALNTINDTVETVYRPRARALPTDQLNQLTAQATTLIDSNPDLTPIERDAEKRKVIRDIARSHLDGLSPDQVDALDPSHTFVDKVVGAESSGDPNAKNPRSTATGLGGFIESTWKQFIEERHPELMAQGGDIQKYRSDRALSREAVGWYAAKNTEALQDAGEPVTDGNLYLAHFAGPQGAIDLLQADPNASAESVLGSKVIAANPFLKGKLAGDVIGWAAKKMEGTTPDAFRYLTDEDWAKALSKAETKRNEQRKEYMSGVQDYAAFLRAGNEPDGRYSAPELEAALGPDDGANVQKALDESAAYGADVAATKWATPDDLAAIIARRKEALSKPDQYRENAQNLAGLLGVIKDRNDAINRDPAAYAAQDDDVAAAYQKVGDGDEVAAAAYAEKTLALQGALGVLPSQQRILPDAFKAQIIDQFKSQPRGGQNPARVMEALSAQWGKYWPQVFGELSDKLPATALVIGAMNRPLQQRAAEQLAEASNIGTEELEKALPKDSVKAIRDNLPDTMADFAATLSANPAGARTLNTFTQGIYQLALSYAAQGDGTSRALQRAYDDVVGSSYTLEDTYRVPVEWDADAISSNADKILGNVVGGFQSPPSLTGLPEEETASEYLKAVKRDGFWVTSPDESGLTLYDGTRRIVRNQQGDPIRFTWQEILDYGRDIPEPPPTNRGEAILRSLRQRR